jgi:hypothetical protein
VARPRKRARAADFDEQDEPEGPPPPAELPADPVEHWPTIVQCEADTGIPASTLRRWCNTGRLKSVLRHGSYRVDPQAALELNQQEERTSKVEETPGLVRQEVGLAPAPSAQQLAALQASQALPAGLLTAASDVIRQGQLQTQQASSHVEETLKLLLGTVKVSQSGFQDSLEALLAINKSLAEENRGLRSDLKDFWETQKTDKIKAKELEIRSEAVKEGLSIAKLLAPQLLSFAMAKVNPSDPDASDRGIAAVLQSLTQEQAIELHTKKLITDAQAQEALGFRVAGTAARGAMTRWIQTFSVEQIGNIVASGVLKKEQSLALTAAHEAASKIQTNPALSTGSEASSASSSTRSEASSPSSSTRSEASSPSSSTAAGSYPVGARLFLPDEVETIRALFAVMLESAEAEIMHKGDRCGLLTFVVEKMGPLAPQLKSIRWDRTP